VATLASHTKKHAPPIPIKNPLAIAKTLHILGDLNAKEMQYVNPASAGPNKKSIARIPGKMPRELVVRISTSKMNICATTAQRGI
jgi:hypothetical protein